MIVNRIAFVILISLCQISTGQSRFSTDPYGNKIVAVKLPAAVEKRTVRIGQMSIGEHVQVYSDAMIVDDKGRCWLKPKYVASTSKEKGDLEIINNKLGYIVHVNYKYVKTDTGYSVPRWPHWERGYVPHGYIPVKSIVVDKPRYDEGSPSDKLSRKMQRSYEPNFTQPQVPSNPYSMENHNARFNVRFGRNSNRSNFHPTSPGSSREIDTNRSPAPTPGFDSGILPELFLNN